MKKKSFNWKKYFSLYPRVCKFRVNKFQQIKECRCVAGACWYQAGVDIRCELSEWFIKLASITFDVIAPSLCLLSLQATLYTRKILSSDKATHSHHLTPEFLVANFLNTQLNLFSFVFLYLLNLGLHLGLSKLQFKTAWVMPASEEVKIFRVTSRARQNVLENILRLLFISFLKLQMAMIRKSNFLSCIIRQPSDFPTLAYHKITFSRFYIEQTSTKSRNPEKVSSKQSHIQDNVMIDSWKPSEDFGWMSSRLVPESCLWNLSDMRYVERWNEI